MSMAWAKGAANPGSDEALAKGCICAVIDNHHGQRRPVAAGRLVDHRGMPPARRRGDDRVKVLVTGGNGFIGRAVCAELANRGHEQVVLDRHLPADPGTYPPQMLLGDIKDATAVTEAVAHVDGVIHLAGVLGTQETITNPRPAVETNIRGGINILEACTQYGVPLVNIAVGNWFESSTYSITKTTVERFTQMYAKYRGLQACSVRAYNAYGPGQSVAQPYGTSRVRKIIPSFVSRALHGETIQVYGDGQQVMDMILVDDVARCLVAALAGLDAGLAAGTYAAGTGRRTTVGVIAATVQAEVKEQTGTIPEIEYLPMRPGETPGAEVLADPGEVRALGVDPAGFVPLEEGLRRTVTFYRDLFAA